MSFSVHFCVSYRRVLVCLCVSRCTQKALKALGDFYAARGEFGQALTNYTSMRTELTTPKQSLEMCLLVTTASVLSGAMTYVSTHASRVRTMGEADNVQKSQCNAALGLYNLKSGSYRQAAERFLEVSVEMDGKYKEVISGRDVAIYGALCGLATYNRNELKTKVANSLEFKQLLELAPGWRQIVSDFCLGNYAQCFAALEKAKADLALDVYLAPHVEKLYNKIRDRALIQYFKPFVAVKLPAMAAAFQVDVPTLEKQLVQLIASNQISARIDSANKILYARHADQRTETFQQALQASNRYIRDVKSLLLRMSLIKHNFVVRPPEGKKRREDERGQDKD